MPVQSTTSTGASNPSVGGVIVGISSQTNTTEGRPVTQTFPVTSVAGSSNIDGKPKSNTDTGAYNAKFALSNTGTFGYENGMLFYGYSSTLNGSSNTVLRSAGKRIEVKKNNKLRSFGLKTSTAMRSGYLNMVGVSGARRPWSTYPSANTGQYISTTNNSNAAVDEGIFVTYMSVPGELVYMVSVSGTRDDYDARH